MNRRVTGLLAWCGLALVIAVPSAEVLFSGGDDTIGVAAPQDAASADFAVPQKPTGKVATTAAADMPFQPLAESVASADDVAGPELDTTSGAPEQISEPLIAGKPLPLPPIVPAGARLPETKVAVVEPNAPIVETPTAAQGATEVAQVAVLEDDTPSVENLDAQVPSAAPTEVIAQEDLVETAAPIAPEVVVVALAPVPQPYKERPAYVTATARQSVTPPARVEAETQVRGGRSFVRLRAATRLRGEAIDGDAPFWGDNPRLRTGRRLDSFPSVEILADEDDASDSGFYELWQDENQTAGFRRNGSFEEQLPARRGSSVRLDLLQ